MISIHVAMFVW